MAKLTIHVGANKTGSSAVQSFLARNSAALVKAGILVPDGELGDSHPVPGNHVWYFEDNIGAESNRAAALNSRFEALFGRGDIHHIILSAENLAEHTTAYQWFAVAAERYQTQVVVYLRRQDELLLSSWQQWFVKADRADLWGWLLGAIGVIGDWRAVLERWESVAGRDGIQVRLYESQHLVGGEVVSDFAALLGLDGFDVESPGGVTANPSMSDAVSALVCGGGFFDHWHDNGFYEFLEEYLGASVHRRRNESLINFEQRMAVIQRYSDINRWVKERYFGDDPSVPLTLFTPPASSEYVVKSREELLQEQMQIIARALYEVDKRLRKTDRAT